MDGDNLVAENHEMRQNDCNNMHADILLKISNLEDQVKIKVWVWSCAFVLFCVLILSLFFNFNVSLFNSSMKVLDTSVNKDDTVLLMNSYTNLIKTLGAKEAQIMMTYDSKSLYESAIKAKSSEKSTAILNYLTTKENALHKVPLNKAVNQNDDLSRLYYLSVTERFDREFRFFSVLVGLLVAIGGVLGFKTLRDFKSESKEAIQAIGKAIKSEIEIEQTKFRYDYDMKFTKYENSLSNGLKMLDNEKKSLDSTSKDIKERFDEITELHNEMIIGPELVDELITILKVFCDENEVAGTGVDVKALSKGLAVLSKSTEVKDASYGRRKKPEPEIGFNLPAQLDASKQLKAPKPKKLGAPARKEETDV